MSNAPQLWFFSSYWYISFLFWLWNDSHPSLLQEKGMPRVCILFLVPDIRTDIILPRQFFWAWRVCQNSSTA